MDRRTLLASFVAAGASSSVAAADGPLSPQQIAERFASSLTAHDIGAFGALFSEDYINHQVSAAAPPPPATMDAKQATVGFFASRLRGMPDLSVAVEVAIATADHVAASFVYTGTHQGTYLGVPPTGRPLRFTSCDIFRIRDGKIAEHWGMGDIAGTLAQMKS